MKKIWFIAGLGLGLLVLLLAVAACQKNLQPEVDRLTAQVADLEEANKTLKDIAGPLPASLDNLHPPKAPAPVWFFEMFALEEPFAGIIVDLQEQDIAGVQANFQAFKAQYQKMAGMVPEWTDRFPLAPVDALGTALTSGDPAKVGPALGAVGQVCTECHLLFLTKAHQKYFWPDFRTVRVTDPVTNETVVWKEYMFRMSGSFSAVGNDLKQGQLDKARQNFQDFSARFKALPTNGCVNCHATPRTYFASPDIQAMVDQFGQALAATPPDANALQQLGGAIGNESCGKCHLVHFPAATAKNLWDSDMYKNLFK